MGLPGWLCPSLDVEKWAGLVAAVVLAVGSLLHKFNCSFYWAFVLCQASCQVPGDIASSNADVVPVFRESVVWRKKPMLFKHLYTQVIHYKLQSTMKGS